MAMITHIQNPPEGSIFPEAWNEREYSFLDREQREKFILFMESLGYTWAGPYCGDNGISIVFYIPGQKHPKS